MNPTLIPKALRMLCYASMALGVVLFIDEMALSGLCFLFAIACAFIERNERAGVHHEWARESYAVVLSLFDQLNHKLSAEDEGANRPPRSEPTRLFPDKPEDRRP